MFGKLFKGFKMNDIQSENIYSQKQEPIKSSAEESTPKVESKPIQDQIPVAKVETENTAMKATKKIAQYIQIYQEEFQSCKRLDEVIDTYIKLTDSEDCLDELRLQYVSMYLFNSGISKDQLNVQELSFMIAKKITPDHKAEHQKQKIQERNENSEDIPENNEIENKQEEKVNDVVDQPIVQSKVSLEFNNLKQIYTPIFVGKKNYQEVLKAYISSTDNNELFEELRLRYLSMYLFNSGITKNKLNSVHLKYSIGKLIEPSSVEEIISNVVWDNDKLYLDIKKFIENQLDLINKSDKRFEIDEVFINIIASYGDNSIEQDFFMGALLKVLEELKLPLANSNSNDIKSYLKQKLFHIKLIKFWESEA